jgi:hypothetical protein
MYSDSLISFINDDFIGIYMKYEAKSVVFGRKPRQNPDEFKTAFFKLYGATAPLETEEFPLHELDFPNTEKVIVVSPNISYYLEGNDLVFDAISEVTIDQDETTVTITVA